MGVERKPDSCERCKTSGPSVGEMPFFAIVGPVTEKWRGGMPWFGAIHGAVNGKKWVSGETHA